MIMDIKNCIRMYKYGYSNKINLICSIAFFALSIFFLMVGSDGAIIGSIYYTLSVCMLVQVMYNSMFVGFIASSPLRGKMEIRYIDIINWGVGLPGAIIYMVICLLFGNCEDSYMEIQLVSCGLMAMVMFPYLSFAFKYFIPAIVYMIVGMNLILGIPESFGMKWEPVLKGNIGLAIILYIAGNVLGILLAHVLRRILYRRNYSKFAIKMES